MDAYEKVAAAIAVGVFCVLVVALVGLITSSISNDHRIAESTDPIATACALGRKTPCLLMGQRK